jgi:hypothetical protein
MALSTGCHRWSAPIDIRAKHSAENRDDAQPSGDAAQPPCPVRIGS